MEYRIGIGLDTHRLKEGLPLYIGNIHIPYPQGADGHSDGDVLIHAMIDAMLGALAMKDIGTHFPDTDIKYKGMDSLLMLKTIYSKIELKGWSIHNMDCTIVIEKPKLSKFIPLMIEKISLEMHWPLDALSIKAKTAEQMGFLGRKEGLLAQVVCLLKKK